MAVTSVASGSQTAVINTEHDILAATTTAGVYQVKVDLGAMVNGTSPDIVELRIYGKSRTADTERVEYFATYVGAQGAPLVTSVPVTVIAHIRVTLRQTQGTGRAFPFNILTL